jgi:predicted DNA-binding protein (MmcQ/YjbR family)
MSDELVRVNTVKKNIGWIKALQIILDGNVPDKDIHRMVEESYEITKPN